MNGLHIVTVPEGTSATIAIPKAEMEIAAITLNDRSAAPDREEPDYLYFTGLPAGMYHFKTEYTGTTPEYVEGAYQYPAGFLMRDTETRGNWQGIYGSDGYVLPGYEGRSAVSFRTMSLMFAFQKVIRFPWLRIQRTSGQSRWMLPAEADGPWGLTRARTISPAVRPSRSILTFGRNGNIRWPSISPTGTVGAGN